MLKRIKTLFLSILVLFGLASCVQTKYLFKDITNHEVTDIARVFISYGPKLSSIDEFSGDYEKVFDVEYVLSDMKYNETREIVDNYKYCVFIDFIPSDNNNYKLYYFDNDFLYESIGKVDYSEFYTNKAPIAKVETLNVFVMYDYGNHINNKVTTLLDGNLIWFNPKDYGIDTLVAGDELIIKYTGEFICEESYPGNVAADLMHIVSIEVIEADIVEFVVERPSNYELMLNAVDPDRTSICYIDGGSNVVSQNGDFFYSFDLKTGDVVYGSVKKGSDKFETYYLHDYNPREEIVPTGQFEVSIIDKGNDIIDSLSNDPGMYTPGTMLEFYSHPIMDVDLAMYVNEEFYKTQYAIRVNDEYIWKYTFVMPAKDVVIEFKIIDIEYTDVRNALDIPDISIDDIIQVRSERGFIGVAPGSLTNIVYSTDFEDRNNVLNILEMPVYEDITNNWQICGGSYFTYSIFTNDERYDIRIANGYISFNQKHYKFLGEYVTFEYPSDEVYLHSFITYLDTATVYRLDWIYSDLVEAEKICEINNIGNLEFVECDWSSDNFATHEIVTEFGSLYVYDSDVFCYDGMYYKITNENFSFYEMFK